MNPKDMERLALLIALDKAIKPEIDRNNPRSLRAAADAELLEGYDRTGVDRMRIRVNGKSVGTISVTSTPGHTEHVAMLVDDYAFCEWFTHDGNGWTILQDFLRTQTNRTRFMEFVADYMLVDSEVIPGIVDDTPFVDEKLGTTARGFKTEEIADAFGMGLDEAVAHALMPPKE